jgi:hypothetical protein
MPAALCQNSQQSSFKHLGMVHVCCQQLMHIHMGFYSYCTFSARVISCVKTEGYDRLEYNTAE